MVPTTETEPAGTRPLQVMMIARLMAYLYILLYVPPLGGMFSLPRLMTP